MKSLSLIIKPVSNACNMQCRYCFCPSTGEDKQEIARGLMTGETLEEIVKKAMAYPEKECVVGFQGGEPTLAGLGFFREFVELEKKFNTKNLRIVHTLSTNGLLIDDEWAGFLAENHFETSVSIDAGKQIHDQMRPDQHGRDTHNRIIEAVRTMREHDVDFTVVSVVTRALARHPDRTYRYFKDKNFRYVDFVPCMDLPGAERGSSPHSLDAAAFGKFLCRVFDLWHEDFVRGDYYSIRMFDNYVHMLAGQRPESCKMAGQCRAYMLVEADGTVFPCEYYTDDKYRLGNVHSDEIAAMLEGEAAGEFVKTSRQMHDDCAACGDFFLCRGGCRRDREPVINGIPGKNVHCEAFKMLFRHALPRLKELSKGLLATQAGV